MTTLLNPYFGEFGGMYVPQILMPALRQLEEAFVSAQKDPEFQAQFNDLLKNYAGRPTALTKCQNITAGTNTTLYLKREDLLHGGAHKTNQVLGQSNWSAPTVPMILRPLSGWVKPKSSPKPVPVSMAWRRPLPAPCSA